MKRFILKNGLLEPNNNGEFVLYEDVVREVDKLQELTNKAEEEAVEYVKAFRFGEKCAFKYGWVTGAIIDFARRIKGII